MDFNELAKKIESIEQMTLETREIVVRVEHEVQKKGLTIDDICREYLHRSERWARERPWSLPAPDVIGRPTVWWRSTCDEYYSVPLSQRQMEYFQKLRRKKAS